MHKEKPPKDYTYNRNSQLKYLYGISSEDYENMAKKQNYVCAICNEVRVTKRKLINQNLYVDHDHETGRVRGLLCHYCNLGLGKFQDSVSLLKSAINYLTKDKE